MRWASAGFVVIAPAYPLTNGDASTIVPGDLKNQPADASFVVTSVLSLAAQPGDSFAGLVDADHVAAAGHSEGALTTAGLFTACCRDGRMSAAIVMAGNSVGFGNDFTGSPAAMLFVHGEDDPLVPIGLGHRTWEAVAWPKGFMTLPGQGHIDPYIRPETSAFPAVAAATTDFLRWTLKGDTSALDALRRDGNVTGVARLEDKF
jgi:pimeloyl-ACP methyl ester carboxylesterase